MDREDEYATVERRLAAELLRLQHDEFVVVGEPVPPPARRRFLRRAPVVPTRYVQARRSTEWLQAECVGATTFGGTWPVTEGQHAALRELGWRAPGDPDDAGDQPTTRNYWRTLPRVEAEAVAAMAVDALRVLGADPVTLRWSGPT